MEEATRGAAHLGGQVSSPGLGRARLLHIPLCPLRCVLDFLALEAPYWPPKTVSNQDPPYLLSRHQSPLRGRGKGGAVTPEAPLTPRVGVQEAQSCSSGQQVCVWSPGPVSSPRPEGTVVSPASRSLKVSEESQAGLTRCRGVTPPGSALGGHPVITGSEGHGPARSRQSGQEQCPSSSLRGWGPCGLSAEALRREPGLPGKTMVAYSVCSGTQGAGGSGVFSRLWKSSSP